VLLGCAAVAAAQARDQERVEYWQKEHGVLSAAEDARVAKVHDIFQRLVQVAGRSGVMPRLLITTRDPWHLVLPIALPDGSIVLSKGTLDICYQDPVQGEDRLAFVLAHELAHFLNDDFWHLRFFHNPTVARTADNPGLVVAKELRADERGIIYAAMAGFHPHAIVTERTGKNFFAEWVRALEALGRPTDASVPPTPQERAAELRTHLRRVADATSLFQLGLWSYYAGDYPRAVQAFDAFRATFPGREVYHNLAVSHHQLALQAYQRLPIQAQSFPFHLSLAIEPLTRASTIYLERTRGQGAAPAEALRLHLQEAIRGYEEALKQEPNYPPAALNLGAALILHGVQTPKPGRINPDFVEAVQRLSRALDQAPASPAMLNNLGVAYFYEEHPDHAKAELARAHAYAPTYAAPVCNLGEIARAEHRVAEAHQYLDTCAQLTARPTPSPDRPTPETVHGLTIGTIEHHLPTSVGLPTRSMVTLDGKSFALATYPTGVMTLVRNGEILMLMARDAYQGSSAQGLKIGSHEADVLARYGPPSRRHELTQGQNWAYDDDAQRITFQLRNGRVVSWLVF
jgi:tetratricopeptide (TPR) repeat protein